MKYCTLIVAVFLLSCCENKNSTNADNNATRAVINTDKEFNQYCIEHGRAAAFIKYADTGMVSLGENQLPTYGLEALKKKFAKQHDTTSKLTWEPERGEASGNIGYTFGWWKYAIKDTTYQGVYMTVWKKQPDGTWKYVLDGGNDTPARHVGNE